MFDFTHACEINREMSLLKEIGIKLRDLTFNIIAHISTSSERILPCNCFCKQACHPKEGGREKS
jgi:hypothetical protein